MIGKQSEVDFRDAIARRIHATAFVSVHPFAEKSTPDCNPTNSGRRTRAEPYTSRSDTGQPVGRRHIPPSGHGSISRCSIKMRGYPKHLLNSLNDRQRVKDLPYYPPVILADVERGRPTLGNGRFFIFGSSNRAPISSER